MTKIMLALSGGGAAGLGHIPVLQALDDLGIRPAAISGTSIGAIIGAGYASGLSGAEIREWVLHLANSPLATVRRFWASHLGDSLNPFKTLDARSVLDAILPETVPATFEGLEIPTIVVATDYFARKEAHFSTGVLRDALAASFSLPGIFSPAIMRGRLYLDGGITNNLPFDAFPEGDTVVAVDVSTEPPVTPETLAAAGIDAKNPPSALAVSMEAMRIMMVANLNTRLQYRPPTILIKPASSRFQVLDFRDVPAILAAAESAREETKRLLDLAMSGAP